MPNASASIRFGRDFLLSPSTPKSKRYRSSCSPIRFTYLVAADEVLASKASDFDRKQLQDLLDGAIYGRRFARYVLLRLE